MPCIVKKTFEEAAAAGALLIAQVKDNQPTLHQCAEQVCQTSTPVDQTTTKDAKRRSRDETRVVEVGEFGQLRPGSLLPGARLKPTAAKLETVSVERKYSDITWHYAKAKKAQERGQGRDSSHLAYDGGICRAGLGRPLGAGAQHRGQ
jgi:hypothetical protein